MEPTSIAGKPLAARCRTFHQCDMVFRTDYDGFYGACHACRSRVGKQMFCARTIESICKDYRSLRSLQARPRGRTSQRDALTTADPCQAGWSEGHRTLPYRCTVPGLAVLRWRSTDEQPPAARLIQSPYDVEARYSQKRETQWVGYKVHLSETCDVGQPDLITQVSTTPATTSDCVMAPVIQEDVAARDLVPGTHLVDSGYVVADVLVNAQQQHIDVVGPPLGSSSRQRRDGHGYDLHAFAIDWEAQQAQCPQGQRSVKWTLGRSQTGASVIRIRFDRAICRACLTRSACTTSPEAPRQLTVKPQALHEARQTARQRQETPEFRAQYALRAGVESTLSQAVRRFDLRQSRYIGLARMHLQQVLTATAMNIVRVIDWLRGRLQGDKKRPAGRFARLAPGPLAIGALASARVTYPTESRAGPSLCANAPSARARRPSPGERLRPSHRRSRDDALEYLHRVPDALAQVAERVATGRQVLAHRGQERVGWRRQRGRDGWRGRWGRRGHRRRQPSACPARCRNRP